MRCSAVFLPLCALLVVSAHAQSDLDTETQSARALASQLVLQLGGKLKAELAAGGPQAAIQVCRQAAPDLAGKLSREQGIRVARVSLRVRNPLLGTADAWEQQGLAEFERRAAGGEKAESLEIAAFVDEPAGRYFRFMKAIPVQPMCLSCHGTPADIPAAVREELRIQYPLDRAVGYSVGQVRGAVTIKKALD